MCSKEEKIFFWPYIKNIVNEQRRYNFQSDICQEFISDAIPSDINFFLEYFKKFPDKLDEHVFNIVVDTELKNILHDVVVRHACKIIQEEIECFNCHQKME